MTKTVSLETAKLLKEAGWAQELKRGNFYYFEGRKGLWWVDFQQRADTMTKEQYTAAPDTTELLEALPSFTNLVKTEEGFDACKELHIANGSTPAEALAALWLELRKQKII